MGKNYGITQLVAVTYLVARTVSMTFEKQMDPGAPLPSFECLNGKDPSTLTKKEILKEFSKGKCSPMVVVPGLLSTKMMIKIKNCELLRNDFPDLFAACGFNACEKKWDEFWKKVPLPEYLLWIPALLSPLNIFTISSSNFCFAKFIKQTIDFTKPIEQAIVDNNAYSVGLYGDTPETYNYFNCGDGAIIDLMPFPYQTKESKTFAFFFEKLKNMGHIPGLTYQSLPYNFAKSYRFNELHNKFSDNIIRLNQLTGKKVIILAHSLGNLNTFYQLSKINSELKRKIIKSWIALTPPFLGSLKVQKILLSGDDDLIFLDKIIGLHVRAAIEGFNNLLVTYELQYRDAYTLYASEKWFEAINNRTLYEHGKLDYQNSGFEFLPPLEDQCSPSNYLFFSSNCTLGLTDTSKKPIISIMSDHYKLNEFYESMGKWNLTENSQNFLNLTEDKEFLKLANPEIPIILMVLRTSNTFKKFNYTEYIPDCVKKGRYCEPLVTWGHGDSTVPTNSAYIPVLKWAHEFDSKLAPNAQPVKIIDICSVRNVKDNVYDIQEEDKEYLITKNEFVGMNCECIGMKTPDSCSHASILTDKYFIDMVTNISMANEICRDPAHDAYIDQLEDSYLDDLVYKCPQVRE